MMGLGPIAPILGEGLDRRRGLSDALWAKRQLGVSVWETKCREAMLQVCWEMAKGMGRRAVGTLRCRLDQMVCYHTRGTGTGAGCSIGPRRRQTSYGHRRGTSGCGGSAGTRAC